MIAPAPDNFTVSLKRAATILGMGTYALKRYIELGEFEAVIVGAQYKIRLDEIDRFREVRSRLKIKKERE